MTEGKHIKPGPVVVALAFGVASALLFALVAWWLGPLVFGDAYTLGYWQTFGLIFFLRMIAPWPSGVQYQDTLKTSLP